MIIWINNWKNYGHNWKSFISRVLSEKPNFEVVIKANLNLINLENELRDCLTEFIRKESKKIYRELESAYESNTSRESAIELIHANEYTFLENGKRINKIAILSKEM